MRDVLCSDIVVFKKYLSKSNDNQLSFFRAIQFVNMAGSKIFKVHHNKQTNMAVFTCQKLL